MLKQTFISLLENYETGRAQAESLWSELETAYTSKGRYYHTLAHLESLVKELSEFRTLIADWNVVLFSVFYHDIVYNVVKHDNEEESARIAVERLRSIGASAWQTDRCAAHILATKKHTFATDPNTNLFTDADLSILGKPWDVYEHYVKQIRREYSIYPDLIYKRGRNKVLAHFLAMERIFKTIVFYDKYEQQARQNIARETELL